MNNQFFEQPILNSPYQCPERHWELDENGQPTQDIKEQRRRVEFIAPVPNPSRQKGRLTQQQILSDQSRKIAAADQQYDLIETINSVRNQVDRWRKLPDDKQQVTPQTARLLAHWRHHQFSDIRPFFCQLEAVETVIWLTEVASRTADGKALLEYLKDAGEEANAGLARLALKLATGAGKTTIMAMLIAWQTVNAAHHPNSTKYTRGFLVITPGITIRDRLRVLQPNDPESYYESRQLLPRDMLPTMQRAVIIITNYHALRLRERVTIASGTRALLQGRGDEIKTTETEGQMLQRVMPKLLSMKNIMVLNDEAHHCYQEKTTADETKITVDEKEEVKKNKEAARLWISGIYAVKKKLNIVRVVDLSATPFFLRGSGYAEGTLFPWTMSDFSLMDAIECGIVKLPRVPISDNHIVREEMPIYRYLWKHIRKDMPKRRRGGIAYDPLQLPSKLLTALNALYGHYEKTHDAWDKANLLTPPCFIVVCNNTSTSKLIYDYISGFTRENENGKIQFQNGRLKLFRNYDDDGRRHARPNTLLIDSVQIESGGALDSKFRLLAKDEIERFRRDILIRTGNRERAENITDQELLREVMNTVGKPSRLGESIRCVVSVSMLTEGWDANTVTHILGVRAFGTQLLCEQVVGRALRRQSYNLNADGLFDVEYADVLGIPFDFTSEAVVPPPPPPRPTYTVKAIRPERDAAEICFPCVTGYRVELPDERLTAKFTADSTLQLTSELVGPTEVENSGIIGEKTSLDLQHLQIRTASLVYALTHWLIETKWNDPGEPPKLHLFGQLKRITREWLTNHLECTTGTRPALLMYRVYADMACERITLGIVQATAKEGNIKAMLEPFNPLGSTKHVRFNTSKPDLWKTDSRYCHINYAVTDSTWEDEFCRVVERHPKVKAYVKNHNLGLEVPYRYGSTNRRYIPDFIVLVDDGHGADDLLHLIVEIKGYRGEDAKDKKMTMEIYWIPGVNHHKRFGRWAFAEFTDVNEISDKFGDIVEAPVKMDGIVQNEIQTKFNALIDNQISNSTTTEK